VLILGLTLGLGDGLGLTLILGLGLGLILRLIDLDILLEILGLGLGDGLGLRLILGLGLGLGLGLRWILLDMVFLDTLMDFLVENCRLGIKVTTRGDIIDFAVLDRNTVSLPCFPLFTPIVLILVFIILVKVL